MIAFLIQVNKSACVSYKRHSIFFCVRFYFILFFRIICIGRRGLKNIFEVKFFQFFKRRIVKELIKIVSNITMKHIVIMICLINNTFNLSGHSLLDTRNERTLCYIRNLYILKNKTKFCFQSCLLN